MFHVETCARVEDPVRPSGPPTPSQVLEVPINEAELPPDLRTDNINNADTILHWSGSSDPSEEPIPGTGEEPL